MLKWNVAMGKTVRLLQLLHWCSGQRLWRSLKVTGKTEGDRSAEQEKGDRGEGEKVLYIWAQGQAHVAPDFLAVIDFDESLPSTGRS